MSFRRCVTAWAAAGVAMLTIAASQGGAVVLPASSAVSALGKGTMKTRPYGWPLRPFGAQHAIRGGFGDPRLGRRGRSFHFGIDISAKPLTPVFAVAPGTVFLAPDRVAVLNRAGGAHATGFSYWHIFPAVREHAFVRRHTLIGWVYPTWGHLHFAELQNGSWMNPVRLDALTPYRDAAVPRIDRLSVSPSGFAGPASGRVNITVDAFVPPPLRPPAPWDAARLAPTVVRWRLLSASTPDSSWTNAVDFSRTIPPNRLYGDVYAAGTTPNRPFGPGRYVLYLAHNWSTSSIAPGDYRVQVEVLGSRGAAAFAATELEVGSGPAAGRVRTHA